MLKNVNRMILKRPSKVLSSPHTQKKLAVQVMAKFFDDDYIIRQSFKLPSDSQRFWAIFSPYLDNDDLVGELVREFFQFRCNHLAWSTPGCMEIHNNEKFSGRFQFGFEIGLRKRGRKWEKGRKHANNDVIKVPYES